MDGKIAFSGGVNIADEYINIDSKFGHWKDIGFHITGEGVVNYTHMFIEFWNAFSKDKILVNKVNQLVASMISKYEDEMDSDGFLEHDGYVQPYYDTPSNQDPVSNTLYIDLLSQATEYAWFYTPYLMFGDNLLEAFIRAAHRGIDIRIYMPGIPDKRIVYLLSRSYYYDLLQAGVRIFEYTPGFLHGKACLVDDTIGAIGTVNLDYRSLFLYFECNSLFYQSSVLKGLKEDMIKTEALCRERSLSDESKSIFYHTITHMLRVFAPLF